VRRSDQSFFLGVAEHGDAAVHVQLFVDVVQVNLDRPSAEKKGSAQDFGNFLALLFKEMFYGRGGQLL
jgi:hypothetical protein